MVSLAGHILRQAVSVLVCLYPLTSLALELEPDAIRGKQSKSNVSVLQNRYFLKAMRPELGLLAGTVLNEAYTDTTLSGARLGIFFNEWIGMELQSITASTSRSADSKALDQLKFRDLETDKIVSPQPEVNHIKGFSDVSMVYAPFYGKMNLIDDMIVYTDLYGTVGLSQVNTDQGTKSGISFGGGERFYFGKAWSLRVEFKLRNYEEVRAGNTSTAEALSVDFGLSYFFL